VLGREGGVAVVRARRLEDALGRLRHVRAHPHQGELRGGDALLARLGGDERVDLLGVVGADRLREGVVDGLLRSVGVDSPNGAGATFWFELPRA
jgi:hypothetical protein